MRITSSPIFKELEAGVVCKVAAFWDKPETIKDIPSGWFRALLDC